MNPYKTRLSGVRLEYLVHICLPTEMSRVLNKINPNDMKAWFKGLLQHVASTWTEPILQLTEPGWGSQIQRNAVNNLQKVSCSVSSRDSGRSDDGLNTQ